MFTYTLCFIKRKDEILLLNREKPQWMGAWNGVGGKIEREEEPLKNIIREMKEETGLLFKKEDVHYKGTLSWSDVGNTYYDGLYLFVAELPEQIPYVTPIKTAEGILDWKKIEWILHHENVGVANLSYFLETILSDQEIYEHAFIYEEDQVVQFKKKLLNQSLESV
ncbi:DNA mismatch repair protein MutT [Alkalihalobacillus alcalophilus ATCC 27647 = CGMCC 1.3604]|uniref:DNA mismatch repair protein MutT n=1 Tax=Alkalihalobacillus alcalophilus ATCC 27647 = CGMCC 1.3604 TaxID=1218173 RepID=A0A094WJB2_ALKAL|nr:8-oxo-dGTP diphosphatase [Alkalihalobacillus alcalophilus]KGA96053.1 DNA mismatch repair protein MutT [Alkalihalobacillus alcalophilus ATCC 27647 = CGMCC 1.3604]MED1563578.1 8-oxo-dGTP diphosphatase [Alkalihalobacillus alcalophilus]THG92285.1 DNA mismatch repair protein MutT [Alkalihalobacillus alcalophilus ATCC 27647 = CGMCC 1.3604]